MRHKTVGLVAISLMLVAIIPLVDQDAYAITCPDPDQTFNSKVPPVITSIVPTTDGAIVTWEQAQLHFHLFFFIQGCSYPDSFDVEVTDTLPVAAPFEFQQTGIAGGDGGTFTITGLQPDTTYYVDVDGHWLTPLFGGFEIQGADSEFTTLAVVEEIVKKGGGVCQNCQQPSIGVTDKGKRVVDGGLTVNGKTVDAQFYKTEYPLIQAPIGKKMYIDFVIWDDRIDNIIHVQVDMAKSKIGESFDADGSMIWNRNIMNNAQTIKSDSMFENVEMTLLDKVQCRADSKIGDPLCDLFHVEFVPMKAIVGDVVFGVSVWDANRNAMTNYFNHGIQIGTEADVILDEPFVVLQGDGNKPTISKEDPSDQRWTDGFKQHMQQENERIQLLVAELGY